MVNARYNMRDASVLGTLYLLKKKRLCWELCRLMPGSSSLTPAWALVMCLLVLNYNFLAMILWCGMFCLKKKECFTYGTELIFCLRF